MRHSAAVDELQRKISELQLKTAEQQKVLEESITKHQQQVDKLYDDRLQLEVCVNSLLTTSFASMF